MSVSICTLPAELLVLMFEIAILEGEPLEYHDTRTAIALVCTQFQAIVYDSPSLWARITVSADQPWSANNFNFSLTLSRNSPLDVTLHLYSIRRPDSIHLMLIENFHTLFLHVHRWQSARLNLGRFPELLRLITSPAPLLETLYLDNTHGEPSDADNLFGGEADRLTSLTLWATGIPWNAEILRNLRVLELDWLHSNSPTVAQLIWIIEASRGQLEVLRLISLSFGEEPLPPPGDPLPLPRLRSLCFQNIDIHAASYLLHHIHPSPHGLQLLSVTCSMYNDDDDPSSFVPLLRPFIPLGNKSAKIELNSHDVRYSVPSPGAGVQPMMELNISGKPALPHMIAILPPSILMLDTTVVMSDIWESEMVEEFFTHLEPAHVTFLNIDYVFAEMDPILLTLSAETFPALERLSLNIAKASPGALSGMVEARRVGGNGTRPLTWVNVVDGQPRHKLDYDTVAAILGPDGLVWKWSNSAGESGDDEGIDPFEV